MNYNYNELIPDEVIDTFYSKIEKCIENNIDYNNYIINIKRLNDNRIPLKIAILITQDA